MTELLDEDLGMGEGKVTMPSPVPRKFRDTRKAPDLSVLLRKSHGQAYLNMGGGRNSDQAALWPKAKIRFMNPAFAVHLAHGSRDEKY